MLSGKRALIIGGGLAGCSLARMVADQGMEVMLVEAAPVFGGLVRDVTTDDGMTYEPHGSHIFHTDDDDAWEFVSRFTSWRPYEHTVSTVVEGRSMTWPLQEAELLAADIFVPDHDTRPLMNEDFESFCRRLMGDRAYELFIRDYTEKQWGRPPSELSAEFAPKRVQVRRDGDRRLFKDRHQWYPDHVMGGSYAQMIDSMIDHRRITKLAGTTVDMRTMSAALKDRYDHLVITVPLDVFVGPPRLAWRGLSFSVQEIDRQFAQSGMVVNWPSKIYPWIRTHEAKHAGGRLEGGTVLVTEFTGGPGRYYPVLDREKKNVGINGDLQRSIRERLCSMGDMRVWFHGRLAEYRYIDMDDVVTSSRVLTERIIG